MTTLDERFVAGHATQASLGRKPADGERFSNPNVITIAPDQWRIICEACFGVLWTRPGLTMMQRSLVTMSVITALRRDDNLRGHLLSGLDVGWSAEQITEIMLQLIFYTGAPIANTALGVCREVFRERGIQVEPISVYDINETPDDLYKRGLAMRKQVLGDGDGGAFNQNEAVDADWDRYLVEYLWGSVWGRPGLDLQQRAICTLTVQTAIGTDDGVRDYVGAALRVGLTAAQVREIMFHLSFYIGDSQARKCKALAEEVISGWK